MVAPRPENMDFLTLVHNREACALLAKFCEPSSRHKFHVIEHGKTVIGAGFGCLLKFPADGSNLLFEIQLKKFLAIACPEVSVTHTESNSTTLKIIMKAATYEGAVQLSTLRFAMDAYEFCQIILARKEAAKKLSNAPESTFLERTRFNAHFFGTLANTMFEFAQPEEYLVDLRKNSLQSSLPGVQCGIRSSLNGPRLQVGIPEEAVGTLEAACSAILNNQLRIGRGGGKN